jgi:hypothetical protein
MGDYCHLTYDDESKEYFMKFRFPDEFRIRAGKSPFSFTCNSICPWALERPHAGCPWCRLRAAYLGKIPKRIRVQPYTIWRWTDRPHSGIKDALAKPIATLLEVLMSL